MSSLVRRLPLSLIFVVGTTVLAVATGALSGGTPASVIDRYGYSLDRLKSGHLDVVPISDWLVVGPSHWASMLLLYALFAVPLEYLGGTGLLAQAFFLGSWTATIATSLAVSMLGRSLHWYPHPDLVHQTDVGGSVGTWAAAGALNVLIAGQARWIVWPVRIGSAVYLGRQLSAVHGTADVAHLLGFCIGSVIGARFVQSRQRPSARVHDELQPARAGPAATAPNP
jgi:hypothetical protein